MVQCSTAVVTAVVVRILMSWFRVVFSILFFYIIFDFCKLQVPSVPSRTDIQWECTVAPFMLEDITYKQHKLSSLQHTTRIGKRVGVTYDKYINQGAFAQARFKRYKCCCMVESKLNISKTACASTLRLHLAIATCQIHIKGGCSRRAPLCLVSLLPALLSSPSHTS